MKPALRLCAALAVCLSFSIHAGCTPAPRELRVTEAQLWTATGSVAEVSVGTGQMWLASAGGLLAHDGQRVVEQLRRPEVAWRGVAARGSDVAAVGLHHVTWRVDGKWQSAAFPADVEGLTLAADTEGWWVGHSGGVQRLSLTGGLKETQPLGPVRKLVSDGTSCWALGQDGFQQLGGEEVVVPPGAAGPWSGAVQNGKLVVAGAGGKDPLALWAWNGHWRPLPRLPGKGAYVTALSGGDRLLAATAAEGWWELQGRRWQRLADLPQPLAEDTASLIQTRDALMGTARGGGVWRRLAGKWELLPLPEELPTANIQALGEYNGAVYASTFDRGLLRCVDGRWERLTDSQAPRHPRQMAVAGGRLYVRETDGTLSAFDGARWERNLLRHQVKRSWTGTLLASPEGLAMGGWGSLLVGMPGAWREIALPAPWSERGITQVARAGDRYLIGTGKHGAAMLDPRDGKVTPLSGGPADPWISATLWDDGRALIGTAGGQLGWTGSGERSAELHAGITAVAEVEGLGHLAATRDGLRVWKRGAWQEVSGTAADSLEPQCLLVRGDALWVGGRHGALMLPLVRK